MVQDVTVVILAAGLGTRMRSKHAKVLHEAGGRALVEHVVRTALEIAPPERVFVVVGHQADRVRAKLAPYKVQFVEQREQKGTGHALSVCREAIEPLGGLVVLLYGDGPLLEAGTVKKLVEKQTASTDAATLITTVLETPRGYGRIVRDGEGRLLAIVEEKAATPEQLAIREVNPGIYCFRSELLWRHIGEIKPDNPAQEYYLTDMPGILRRAGHSVGILEAEDARQLLAVNTRVELAEVDQVFRDRKRRELMLSGVTIQNPETVVIDMDVQVGRDTVIEPFVRLLGRTVIGEDCRIGSACVIEDSVLEDGAEVFPFSMVSGSYLEAKARVGPFARLRMESRVCEGAHVGNFVEMKKTRLGQHSKAMHLAYLGDSTIGAGANIGAGTITCNFDGQKKHPTKIGDDAFVGSNTTLVAPVEVGAGSYVAAGSVITEPVPPDSLGIARCRQTVKPEWAKRRREQQR